MGLEYTAAETQEFLDRWGVSHQRSSAYHPQSNGRAEVAVKAAKRALRDNVDVDGNLNTDRMTRALLAIRNTPHPGCKMSPAEIVFNRKLRGILPISPFRKASKFDCHEVNPMWKEAWDLKEKALRERTYKSMETLRKHSRPLKELLVGDKVFVQNQTGKNSTKWEKSGTVMEAKGMDKYNVKIDGTGRVTTRNRRFLRMFNPADLSPIIPRYASPLTPAVQSPELADQPLDETEALGLINPPRNPVLPPAGAQEPVHDAGEEQDFASPPPPAQPIQNKQLLMLKRLGDSNQTGRQEKPRHAKRRPETHRE